MEDNTEQKNDNRFLDILGAFLDKYEEANPGYLTISFYQLLYNFVYNMQRYIEDPEAKEITWENPFVELQYFLPAADLDKLEARSYSISEEELKDPDKVVDRLFEAFLATKETAFLKAYTRGLALLKEGDKLYMLSPEKETLQELEKEPPIKLPFTVTATDKKGKEREVKVTLSFKINPLTFDRDLGKAYFPIFLGLEFRGYSPTKWSEEDRTEFWNLLLETIKKNIPEEDLDFTLDLPEPEARPISREQALVKVGLHSEMQKLGSRKRAKQMDLEDILNQLEPRDRGKAGIGLDLSESEIKALFAIQKLLDATNYQGNTEGEILDGRNIFEFEGRLPCVSFKPAEYLAAYGVTKFKTGRGYMEYSKAERDHALKTLFDLARRQFVITYTRKEWEKPKRGKGKPVEKEKLIRSTANIFRIKETWDKLNLTEQEKDSIRAGALTEEALKKMEHITLVASPLLVDQLDSYFLLKPSNIYKVIAQLTPQARKRKYIFHFVDYLMMQAAHKGRYRTGWTIKINFKDLAEVLRMYSWIDTRNWKQIRKSLNECYRIAQELGCLESYGTKQGIAKEYEELIINPEGLQKIMLKEPEIEKYTR